MTRNELLPLILPNRQLIEVLRLLIRQIVVVPTEGLHIVSNCRKGRNGVLVGRRTLLCYAARYHERHIHTFCRDADLPDSSFFLGFSINGPFSANSNFLLRVLLGSLRFRSRSGPCCRITVYNSRTQHVENVSCDTSDKYTCPRYMEPSASRKCRDTIVRRRRS